MRQDQCLKTMRNALLSWYAEHQRDLPWRVDAADPYATWVSELMLQQTQVATVIPYYRRWMRRFATVADLAAADRAEVLKCWEGLGYYRRAHYLHEAAQKIVRDHEGKLPRTIEELMALPGIGKYTAGAIASIAFGDETPVVDGNVERVLARVFAIGQPIKNPAVQKRLWRLAEGIIADGQAGTLNQAMMDLGATRCRPKKPLCEDCPLPELCRGFQSGKPERFPVKAAAAAVPHIDVPVAVVRRGGKILITRRGDNGMLAGLWELPGTKTQAGMSLEESLVAFCEKRYGLELEPMELLGTVKHAYSHFRITLHVMQCRLVRGRTAGNVTGNGQSGKAGKLYWADRATCATLAFGKAAMRGIGLVPWDEVDREEKKKK